MKSIFTVDGHTYEVTVPVGGLKRSGQVMDGDKAGRLQTGRMERDIIGTFYNYSLQIETQNLNVAEYDELYQVLSAPVDYHTITLPYGQSTLTFEAYVSNVNDELKLMKENRNIWGGLTFNFVAMEPQRS